MRVLEPHVARAKPNPRSPERTRTPKRPIRPGLADRLQRRPTGSSDAAIAGKPAYSLWPHSVSPLRRLAGGCAPSDPQSDNGAP